MPALPKAEKAYGEVHQQYETVLQELTGYDEVLTEYRTYSMDWMAGSEDGQGYQFVAVDRRDVLDLIESEMMTRGTVSSVSMRDDRVVVGMSGMSLEEISVMFSSIEQHDIVKSVELDVAETERDKPASVLSFTVNIVLNTEQDDAGGSRGGGRMNRELTTREKTLLLVLAVLVIALGYWKLVLEPINEQVASYNDMAEQEQAEIDSSVVPACADAQNAEGGRGAEGSGRGARHPELRQQRHPDARAVSDSGKYERIHGGLFRRDEPRGVYRPAPGVPHVPDGDL